LSVAHYLWSAVDCTCEGDARAVHRHTHASALSVAVPTRRTPLWSLPSLRANAVNDKQCIVRSTPAPFGQRYFLEVLAAADLALCLVATLSKGPLSKDRSMLQVVYLPFGQVLHHCLKPSHWSNQTPYVYGNFTWRTGRSHWKFRQPSGLDCLGTLLESFGGGH
jgi:hypothetical protein